MEYIRSRLEPQRDDFVTQVVIVADNKPRDPMTGMPSEDFGVLDKKND